MPQWISWIPKLITVAILAMGALPKFTGGAAMLADLLPGGSAAVIAIGVAELAAIVLMLMPRTTLIGAGLAMVIMLGAVGSHVVGPVGMEGEFGTMFMMALVALGTSAITFVLAQRRSRAQLNHQQV